ncbi:MAG: site-2 protease family protein [Nitriliruptoraceae bacterium]
MNTETSGLTATPNVPTVTRYVWQMRRFTTPHATIRAIPVRFAPSLALLIVGLLALFWLRLSATTPPAVTVIVSILGATGVLVSTLWHELAHAKTASRRGVVVTDITLLAVGGVTQLATGARSPKDDAAIAAAGPWASLVIGASAGLIATIISLLANGMFARAVADTAGVLAWWNLALAVFNALPGAPLDGGRLVRAAVWARTNDRAKGARAAARAGQSLGLMLFAGGGLVAVWAPLPRTGALFIGAALLLTGASIGRGATREHAALRRRPDAIDPQPDFAYQPDRLARLRFSVSVAVVVTASLVVPLPVIEVAPAPARPIVPLITFTDTITYETDGDVLMLVVSRGQRAALPALVAAVHPHRKLVWIEQVYPAGTDRQVLRNVSLARFARQFDIAVAVGARTVGVETEIVSEVVVIHVQADGPAAGLLRPGDTILAVNDQTVTDATAVQDAIRSHPPATPLAVTIRRAGTITTLAVTPRLNPQRDVVELGIAVDTALEALRLPFSIALAQELRIGGPSAGLAVGLTVVARLTETPLLAGRVIAATGTLDVNGRVGPIGDLPEKMRAAHKAGADLVFVPAEQVDLARTSAPVGLTIIGVDTLDAAIAYLRNNR